MVVTRDHDDLDGACTQCRQRFFGAGFGFIGKRHQRDQLHAARRPLGQGGYGRAPRLELSRLSRQGAHVHFQLLHPAQAADQETACRPINVHIALVATARHGPHGCRRGNLQPLIFGGGDHSVGQRVFAAALQAGRNGQQVRLVIASNRNEVRQRRSSHGQRAGFVERHYIHLVRQLQRLRIFDQNAIFRRDAGARHDGGGRRQPERAGASDDQDRHGVNQCQLKGMPRLPPRQHRNQRDQQHHRHENGAHLIHQPLNRRFAGLRVFHQADDAGQHGLAAHGAHLHHHAALAIDGAAGKFAADFFTNRQRLAGQHRFINLRLALQQCAVHRETLAGFDDQLVAHQHLGHWNINFAIQSDPMRRLRPQRVQRTDGRGGLALGPCLQPFTQ